MIKIFNESKMKKFFDGDGNLLELNYYNIEILSHQSEFLNKQHKKIKKLIEEINKLNRDTELIIFALPDKIIESFC